MSPLQLVKQFLHELNSFCLSTSSSIIDYDSKCKIKILFYFFLILLPYLYAFKGVYFSNEESANQQSVTTSIPTLPLPINICKYRLFEKPSTSANVNVERNRFEDSLEPILITNDDEQEGEDIMVLTPSPKPSPQYIILNSTEEENDYESSSSFRYFAFT